MIAIIDYKAGNLASISRALAHLGFQCRVTREVKEISGAERVIFPGVGSAGKAMEDLKRRGIDKAIYDFCKSDKPFLGICLGSQIILEESEENNTSCLGLLQGRVRRFPAPLLSDSGHILKVPHMGWNQVELKMQHPILEGISPESEFYFVHSYFPTLKDEEAVFGTTDYGITFTSVLGRDNIFAVQFHPEKSGTAGLTLLRNFCLWNAE